MIKRVSLIYEDWEATISIVGASLRRLVWRGLDYCPPEPSISEPERFQGSVIAPWANRIADGRYSFNGKEYQLDISEPGSNNALHGFSGIQEWAVVAGDESTVSLKLVTGDRPGYPWSIQLLVTYQLCGSGLEMRFSATNLSTSEAPFGYAFHPYLKLPLSRSAEWKLRSSANRVLLVDSARLLPLKEQDVSGTEFDFRIPKSPLLYPLDNALGEMKSVTGRFCASLADKTHEVRISWEDSCKWLQLHFPASQGSERESMVIEPTTDFSNIFNSSQGALVLAPEESFYASVKISAHDK
jgi:aldose 1-epimerase